jgi:hypothetical protein
MDQGSRAEIYLIAGDRGPGIGIPGFSGGGFKELRDHDGAEGGVRAIGLKAAGNGRRLAAEVGDAGICVEKELHEPQSRFS